MSAPWAARGGATSTDPHLGDYTGLTGIERDPGSGVWWPACAGTDGQPRAARMLYAHHTITFEGSHHAHHSNLGTGRAAFSVLCRDGGGTSRVLRRSGVDVGIRTSDRTNVRAGFNALSFSHDFDNDGINLAAQLKWRSLQAHLDWFPFSGGFHVSPGIMLYNGNKVEAQASVPPDKTFDLGNNTLRSNPASPVTGAVTVAWEKVAPSLTVGWGNVVPRGSRSWSIPVELGVIFSRAPVASLGLRGSACTTVGNVCRDIATDPGLQRDVQTEQDQMNDDLSVFTVYPVLSVGFAKRF
jgi:hypothetical protein